LEQTTLTCTVLECHLGSAEGRFATTMMQKVNTQSSTEADLVSHNDILAKVLWTRWFLEHQGLKIIDNVVYRDNQSSMKLEQNGKANSGKRTRHFNIKYFYITDLIKCDGLHM